MARLKGKKALVTAAGQGIGRATALAFAAEGAEVVAGDIRRDTLDTLASETGVSTRILDVTDAQAISAAAEELGRLDVLVNCAGIVHHGTVLDASEEDFDTAVTLNLRSMFRTVRAFLPAMLEGGGGSIINIASVVSSLIGAPNRCIYGMTKAGVIGLTKSIARDYVTRGIRCNAICPGTIATPSLEDRIAAFEDPEAAREAFIARQPMGRLGTPEEVAALCVFLAADESAYMTGVPVVIDGGWMA